MSKGEGANAAMKAGLKTLLTGMIASLVAVAASADSGKDQRTVAELDDQYQAAVKNNDAATMDRILADDFVVVIGNGKTYTKADLLDMARTKKVLYEHQEDSEKRVQVSGNTAVVTAKIWLKGVDQGKPFEWIVWFSDTYVRTPSGWRYFHGMASLPLPAAAK
jgi:ketosteroid isomerase-like protein